MKLIKKSIAQNKNAPAYEYQNMLESIWLGTTPSFELYSHFSDPSSS